MTPFAAAIDHVVINVMAKLDEAADQFTRLGFQLTERGHHTLGTSNNLAVFDTDYLELLGFEAGMAGKRPDAWVSPPGLGGLVFKPPADPAFSDALNANGVAAEAAREFSRPVNLADGARDARFRTVNLVAPLPNGRVFFCHHHTPDLVWRDEWRRHPNGAADIVEFTVATADPARSAAVFGRIFGPASLHPVEGGLVLPTDKARVLFLTPETVSRQYAGVAPTQADGSDRMVALGLRTSSLSSARTALRDGGIAGVVEADGLIIVPDTSACGLALTFRA